MPLINVSVAWKQQREIQPERHVFIYIYKSYIITPAINMYMIYSCYIAENHDFVLIFNSRINNASSIYT
jgi:hypothetical protein